MFYVFCCFCLPPSPPPTTGKVLKHRLLGVTVDEQLKWHTHINSICRTVSRRKNLVSKLSQIVWHKAKLAFLFAHIMSNTNYVSNAWDGCACAYIKQLYSLHKHAVKLSMPIPNIDYKQKCCATPFRQKTIAQQI